MELALGIIVFLFGLVGIIFCVKGIFESRDLVDIIFYYIGSISISFFEILMFIKLIEMLWVK